jgi:hypothetical protein
MHRTSPSSSLVRSVAAALLAMSVAAFAQGPAPTPTPASATPTINPPQAPIPPAGAPAAPAPQGLKAFKDTVKDAKEIAGFFTLFEKEDKTWIEIKPEQFDKPFFFSTVRTHGLGERFVISGLMGARHVVYFKRIGNHVQLIAQNQRFRAKAGTAVERAVKSSFSDSLLASAPVVSQPHPDSKAVLIDASALLLSDIPAASTLLEAAFRLPYALDARNSNLVKAKGSDTVTSFEVSLHFAVPKLPAPPIVAGAASVPPPQNTPDARSLFLGYYYNFAKLPEPMRPRIADERVGYFTTGYTDYTDDLAPNPNVYFVNRWRLEKKDPNAALSEPVKPIVYWIDRNIPEKYRQAVVDGILEWNKAFERIGFKDAVQAKLQPENADFDTEDVRHASVRWYLSSEGGPAIGPSHTDPRTGEILDADILMTDVFPRSSRRFIVEDAPKAQMLPGIETGADASCNYAQESFGEAEFALDLLESRGDLSPDSPEAEAFVYAYVKEVITHEVGHTLGLRHNFRSSTAYSAAQLEDPIFTAKNGIVGSVMDYAPFNLPVSGEKRADYVMPTIGPYDYWAIEYAYKPMDPAHEKDELAKIAARGSREPWLAYATDEDSSIGGGSPQGMDPTVNTWDLSDNPLAYYRKRLELSRELWDRLESKTLKEGESYDVLRRSFLAGFTQLSRGLAPATKYIGGVVQVRDRAGSGRMPFTPVSAAQQREALKLLADGAFSVDSFKFKPEFLASLPYNRLDYFDQLSRGQAPSQPMVSIPAQILAMQRSVLDQVMSDGVATRIADSQNLVSKPKDAFQLSELYDTLHASIWSELKSGREITPMRRNLQREHLRRVAGALLHPNATMPADARSLLRQDAHALAAEIRAAQAKPAYSKETRAHLAECLDTLQEALKAPMVRMAA